MPPRRRPAPIDSTRGLDIAERSTQDLLGLLDALANSQPEASSSDQLERKGRPKGYDLDVPYLDVEGLARVWNGLGHIGGVGEA